MAALEEENPPKEGQTSIATRHASKQRVQKNPLPPTSPLNDHPFLILLRVAVIDDSRDILPPPLGTSV